MAAQRVERTDDGPRRLDPYVVAPRLAALLLDSFIVTILQGLLLHDFPAFQLRIENPQALQGGLTLGSAHRGRGACEQPAPRAA